MEQGNHQQCLLPIIDSHIHLFPASDLDTLAWCSPDHALRAQHSVDEFLAATDNAPELRGFVFVETDRKSHHLQGGWEYPLQEVDWIARIANGEPVPGEGHEPGHARLCLGIVPWAPLPLGEHGLQSYVQQVRDRAGASRHLIKGFRYLVQDKLPGTMLEERFVEGLKWLGWNRYTFDLGVDYRSGGIWQLDEAIKMISRAHEDEAEEDKVVIIVNHMCKPNMRIDAWPPTEKSAVFVEWEDRIRRLASFPNTYMKISGAFSEILPLPAHDVNEPWSVTDKLTEATSRVGCWILSVFRIFGPERVMFGSDWPVCNPGGGGGKVAWRNWRWLVDNMLQDLPLSERDKQAVWSSNAAKAYRIS
ncbi:MAG: hypothetical protein M1830_000215 [Pleopsidium flavum]|nr:MAG: hypothetical protein M1830_000215 [Pleopsidium flavum]